jgi:hypothetical protein
MHSNVWDVAAAPGMRAFFERELLPLAQEPT